MNKTDYAAMHPDVVAFGFDDYFWEYHNGEQDALKKYGVAGFLGAAYGDNARAHLIEQDTQAVVKRFGNLDLVARFLSDNEETRDRHVYDSKMTVRLVARSITECRWYTVGDLAAVTTIAELGAKMDDAVSSGGGHLLSLKTAESHEAMLAEERRQELEEYAKAFAAKHKKRLGTLDFIAAVEDAVAEVRRQRDQWNNPERRMEEWGACLHAGVGSSVYFDDLNFENGRFGSRIDNLEGIFEWLQQECPLLMAKYEEEKAAGRWRADEQVEAN
jgi:hypothetical protein